MIGRTSKRDRRGTGQSVDRADNERAQRLIKSRAAKPAIELRRRNRFFGVTVGSGFVPVGVAVNIIAMQMGVLVDGVVIVVGADIFHGAKSRPQIERAEQDQHERNAEFQAHSETLRNHDAEQDDSSTNRRAESGCVRCPRKFRSRPRSRYCAAD